MIIHMAYSNKTREKFIDLRASGLTLAQAAGKLKVAYNTAVNWQRELEEEINAAKAIKLEELMDKYRMTKEKRIELLGERLLAVQKELEGRELSDIPTRDLIEMMIRLSKLLGSEAVNPQFMDETDINLAKSRKRSNQKFEENLYLV